MATTFCEQTRSVETMVFFCVNVCNIQRPGLVSNEIQPLQLRVDIWDSFTTVRHRTGLSAEASMVINPKPVPLRNNDHIAS
ncbi:hypothetical protein KL951_003083 [Ogataea haglerorum]|nr:hypothetical protein KL951_003083 [Ogataea haglerorum]